MSATSTQPGARERIIDAAYDLFAQRGVRAVGVNEVVERADVAKATFYSHFPSKDDLVLAFLDERERRWTRWVVENAADLGGDDPAKRLLAIFDVFDEWFSEPEFEGCSFMNVLLETADREHPISQASALHLEKVREIVSGLAHDAGIANPGEFAHTWTILMKGSILAAVEGDTQAAKRAQAVGRLVLKDS